MSKPQGYVSGCSPEHALLIIGRPKLRASRFRACATRPARRRAAAPLRHRATALASVRCAASIDAQRFVCQLSGGWRCELHGGRLGGSRQDMMSRSAPRRPQQPLSAREGLGRTAPRAAPTFCRFATLYQVLVWGVGCGRQQAELDEPAVGIDAQIAGIPPGRET